MRRLAFCLIVTAALSGLTWVAHADTFSSVAIVTGEKATPVEHNVAQLLADRLRERGITEVRLTEQPSAEEKTLTLWLGVPERHAALAALLRDQRIAVPNATDPGAEGFLLKRLAPPNGALVAAGVDERGVLYATGEILRQCVVREGACNLPPIIDIRTAPAFRLRGTEVSQGATITELTNSRRWTEDERRKVILDYALAGANAFGLGYGGPHAQEEFDFLTSYGLDTLISVGPNTGSGPPEWQAAEAIGRTGYLCLSVPEARQAILDRWEKTAQTMPDVTYIRFYSGDGGGCECERCAPYGKKYIEMCADIAAIISKYHPKTKFFATNQKIDNASDQAIFDYLNAEPRPWLTALAYGPGSNAMSWQPGRRQDHRMDLFDHPAFGPMDRYAREIVHQLPPSQTLVFFTDVTHWVYSEYGLVALNLGPDRDGNTPPHWGYEVYEQHPAPAMDQVYNRRTFHARPRAFYSIFQDTMRYGEGDLTYSEGHHDHFNQWMWQRLLWNPHVTLDEAIGEYTRTWFGPEVLALMAQALLLFEQNLSTPIAASPGIGQYYETVKKAGKLMPAEVMKTNYLWRQHMQRAALDKYIQARVNRQMQRQKEVEDIVEKILAGSNGDAALTEALRLLDSDIENDEMKAFKSEGDTLGQESDALFGVRNEGFFNLDQDFVGLGWLRRQVQRALDASPDKRAELLDRIVHYDDPGEGGFYDDAGDPTRSPHLVCGWPFSDNDVSGFNRASQRRMAYTRGEAQGVTFEYNGLDPNARYRVRMTLVRPSYAERYADRQPQKTESIYANGELLAKDVELPEWESDFFEYDIPDNLTHGGSLQLRFEKAAGVGEGVPSQVEIWRNTGGWGTLVSEVWLMKR